MPMPMMDANAVVMLVGEDINATQTSNAHKVRAADMDPPQTKTEMMAVHAAASLDGVDPIVPLTSPARLQTAAITAPPPMPTN